jgi:hypothetical protein
VALLQAGLDAMQSDPDLMQIWPQAYLELLALHGHWARATFWPPWGEWAVVWLGQLTPCLMVGLLLPRPRLRALACLSLWLAGVLASTLSTALNFGPQHAWAWVTWPTLLAMGLGALAGAALAGLSTRWLAVGAMLALGAQLVGVNAMPPDPYVATSLQQWELGRFIRFYGLTEWLGWLWPAAALVYALACAWEPSEK